MLVSFVSTASGGKPKYHWELIESLVSVEKLGIRLTEESAERNARLDRMEESNQRLVELINEIDTQMLQESVRHSNKADKLDEKIDARVEN